MKFTVSRELDIPAESVWALVGDFGGLAQWSPSIVGCRLEGSGPGSYRIVVTRAGEIRERLDERSDEARRIRYSPVSGSALPIRDVSATIEVFALGSDRARVDWTIEGVPLKEPAAVEEQLRSRYAARLEDLRQALAA